MRLSVNDKKVLYVIMAELSEKNPIRFPEFPELKESEIKDSIEKLSKLNLIKFNKQDNLWWATESGIKITNNENEFKEIVEEFNKNTPHG